MIAMCNYLQLDHVDFVTMMKIREGHLYLQSSLAKAVQRRAT